MYLLFLMIRLNLKKLVLLVNHSFDILGGETVLPSHGQRLFSSTVEVFNTEHLQLRSVLVQISRGLIKSQLVGGQFSKIRGFSVNSDTAPPLNIPCPFICGVVNGPLPMYVYSV